VALERMYGLSFATRRTMDPALMYQAIGQGSVDVISAYTTDGRIAAYNLVVLEDDRQAIPPYDAVILARPGFAELQPDVVAALRRLDGAIDADRMRRLNGEVDENGRSPSVVAAEFVRRLLDSR
jgi:osmoprotectant transport system permease protein